MSVKTFLDRPFIQLLSGLILALLICSYELTFNFFETTDEIQSLKEEALVLNKTIRGLKAQNKSQIFWSEAEFYQWLTINQNMFGVSIQGISGDRGEATLKLAGSVTALVEFMQIFKNSKVKTLNFIKDQSNAELTIHLVDIVPVHDGSTAQKNEQIQAVNESGKVIGEVKRQNQTYCVIVEGDQVMIKKKHKVC